MNNTSITFGTDEGLDEIQRWLREDNDLGVIEELTVWSIDHCGSTPPPFGVRRALNLLELLHARCGELKNLVRVSNHARLWFSDLTARIVRDCPTVQEFTTLIDDRFTKNTLQALSTSSVKRLEICYHGGPFVGSMCEVLCARQEPPRHLILHSNHFDRDALAIFADALPRMRLEILGFDFEAFSDHYEQEDYQRFFKGLSGCLDTKEVYLRMGDMWLDESSFSSMLVAIQSMVALHTLRFQMVKLSKDQWFRLGKAVAKCARMTVFDLHHTHDRAEADAFLDGCGLHPRLLQIVLGSVSSSIVQTRTQRWQNLRARCLTVLLVGSSVQRAGEHSSIYKIPIDIFRRLHSFLPEGDVLMPPAVPDWWY